MQERRRFADDTRDIVIETKAALEAHTELDAQFHEEVKVELGKLDSKLDKLNRNQIFAAGALAALMFLMNYPQVIRVIQPAEAHGVQAR